MTLEGSTPDRRLIVMRRAQTWAHLSAADRASPEAEE